MTPALLLTLALGIAGGAEQAPAVPATPTAAALVKVTKPGERDTCPVCGMFVAKYPSWIATVQWRDGSAVHFDGAKDLFFFVHQLGKYGRGRAAKDVATIAVTEFYDLRTIDARQAYYVVGSDVVGPMGREFIPFATQADAREFLRDHHGTAILRFSDVSLQVVHDVDEGRR